ncbi:MAG: exported protein of unknown function [Candidatus Saccharibacteria bacterium]|nr:exported protein of unknown function [Candidatus Saccharibacteria bacterium]
MLIFVIVLLFNRDSGTNTQTGNKAVVLADYANKDARAELTQQGKVTAQEKRYSVHMTVSRTERVIEVLQGYDQTVLRRETFSNNESAYSTFIIALDQTGFSREKPSIIKDERGACPLGQRYIYELNDGTSQVLRLWNTSCNTKEGTFGGKSTVRQLFQEQFPNYGDITRGITL